jgi:hypothetical protein
MLHVHFIAVYLKLVVSLRICVFGEGTGKLIFHEYIKKVLSVHNFQGFSPMALAVFRSAVHSFLKGLLHLLYSIYNCIKDLLE